MRTADSLKDHQSYFYAELNRLKSIMDELRNDITRLTPASFEPTIDYVVTKIPRFTFEKFPNADATLTSAMDGSMSKRGKRNPKAVATAAPAHVHRASER